MSIQVSWDGYITVSGYDLSDHCVQLVINDGEDSRDVTAMGDTSRRFRAGMGTASIEATFLNDQSTGSVEPILRAHLLAANAPGTKTPATSPTAALAGSTGNLAVGAYRYWVTFTYPAFETSPITYAWVTVASTTDSQVSLTAIPVPTDWYATGKNVYRTQIAGGGSTTGVLLAALASAATSSIDNIPGVKGIGEKTARDLLLKYDTLDDLLAHPERIERERLRKMITDNTDIIRLSRSLATIDTHLPVEIDIEGHVMREPDWPRLIELFTAFEFRSLIAQGPSEAGATWGVYETIATREALEAFLHGRSIASR